MGQVDTSIVVRAKHAGGKKSMGIKAIEGKIGDMYSLVSIEPLIVKDQSMKSDTETACMSLRIDDVISISRGVAGPSGQIG